MVAPFFAAIFAAISSVATTLTTTTVAGISLATIGKFVLGVGLSVWSTSKASNATLNGQSVLNQSTGDRQVGYGLCLLGGTRVYYEVHNRELWQVIVFHHGRVNRLKRFLIEGVKVDLDDEGRVTTEPWKRGSDRYYVNIWSRNGYQNQRAYSQLIDASEGAWTESHTLNGLSSALIKFDHARQDRYANLYPRGANTKVQAIAETSRVYDPRTGTTDYSANSSLVIRDHLVSADGFPSITERDIDEESFSAFADLCDRVRFTTDGSEPMFETHGLYWLSETSKDVHDRMAATCDARVYITPKGLIGIRGGQWTPPRFTITDDMIMEFSLVEGASGFTGFNRLHTYYTDPKQDFQRVEAPIWNDADDQARNGLKKSELYLDMVASPYQAMFLAQIHAVKNNPKWSGTISVTLDAIDALSDELIRIKLTELEINETFLVQRFEIRPDLSGIDLTVSSVDRSAYTPTTKHFETPDIPDYIPDLSIPVPQITSLTFNPDDRIRVEVEDPGFEDLELEAEIQAPGDDWEAITATGYVAKSLPVDTSDTFGVRARFASASGSSEWQETTLT